MQIFTALHPTLALEPLPGTMRVRLCNQCQTAVHLAKTPAEFEALAKQGKCIAWEPNRRCAVVGVPKGRDWLDDFDAFETKSEVDDDPR